MTERNPYLILGVDFACSADDARRAFAMAARRVRRQGGAWAVEDLTWALHEIEVLADHPADLVHVYRVPADPGVFHPAASLGGGIFDPAPVALERASAATSAATMAAVRLSAIAEYDDLVVGVLAELSTPPAPPYEFQEDAR